MAANPIPAPSVLAGIRQALVAHAPFASMRDADVERVVRNATVRYFPKGGRIVPAGSAPPVECLFIRQGSVHGEPADGSRDPGAHWEGTAGELFPLSDLLSHAGPSRNYDALQDTFVIAFPADVFDALIATSPPFADYCTRTLAHLVELERRLLQSEYVQSVTEQRGASTPLVSLLRGAAVTAPPTMPIGEALALMESRRIGSLPIVDGDNRPLGVFTRQDVIGRIVLPQRPLSGPIADVMTTPVVSLPAGATAGDATLTMAARGIRHVVVEGDTGQVVGVVSERDLFGMQRLSVRELASDIRRARDLSTLRQCASDVRSLSYALVAQGVASGQLTRMIASLNDQVVQRVLELVAPAHALERLALCWLGMGSEGRSEQTIATDQDNGLVFVAGEGVAPDAVRERLLPFASEVNHALDALGYPLCKGGVMAMNPRWCASLAEWEASFRSWIDRGDPGALLDAQIFFDFRAIWGSASLAAELRRDVAARAEANPRFLKQLADNALRHRPPLNWFGELTSSPETEDGIDLKFFGTALVVDGARILALASGVTTTNTVQRLDEASGRGRLPPDEARSLVDAFDFLNLQRLRTQHRRAAGLIAPSANPNVVLLRDLSELDRRVLKEAMRQVRSLQQRLELDYPG